MPPLPGAEILVDGDASPVQYGMYSQNKFSDAGNPDIPARIDQSWRCFSIRGPEIPSGSGERSPNGGQPARRTIRNLARKFNEPPFGMSYGSNWTARGRIGTTGRFSCQFGGT
ncbi:hypothetical protein [Streptomyces sp. CA2R106]|uniref:hypothetical protein n=1 Tax=Streptomyces sp. CA2R106 TaxID=3120153 RepID=UPI00300B2075